MFTLQENLPAETVQIITYGAPEMSAYLALTLSGDGENFKIDTLQYRSNQPINIYGAPEMSVYLALTLSGDGENFKNRHFTV